MDNEIELEGKNTVEEEEEDVADDKIVQEADKNTFKNTIQNILKENDFNLKRPSTIPVDEFLNLLNIFNKHKIHFK